MRIPLKAGDTINLDYGTSLSISSGRNLDIIPIPAGSYAVISVDSRGILLQPLKSSCLSVEES